MRLDENGKPKPAETIEVSVDFGKVPQDYAAVIMSANYTSVPSFVFSRPRSSRPTLLP